MTAGMWCGRIPEDAPEWEQEVNWDHLGIHEIKADGYQGRCLYSYVPMARLSLSMGHDWRHPWYAAACEAERPDPYDGINSIGEHLTILMDPAAPDVLVEQAQLDEVIAWAESIPADAGAEPPIRVELLP